jgi:prepilin-type N-terminal cleavage/methylation domain-containing protein
MKLKSSKKGFTLVELLATIGIIAVLSAAVFPFVTNYKQWATESSNDRSARLIYDAVMRYNSLTEGAQLTETTTKSSVMEALTGTGALAIDIDSKNGNDRFLSKAIADADYTLTGASASDLAVTYGTGELAGNAP